VADQLSIPRAVAPSSETAFTAQGPQRGGRPAAGALGWLWLIAGSRPLRLLGRAILIAFGMMCIAFALVRMLPGDPVSILLGENATQEAVSQMRELLGLNGSLPEQFVRYVGGLLHGNLGTSIVNRAPVSDLVGRTLPVTGQLVLFTVALTVVISLPLGTAAAIYRRTRFNYVFRVLTSVLVATPLFFSGLLALLLFAIRLQLAPVAGFEPQFPANLAHLWLPALVMCGTLVPVLARVIQTSVVETLDQEFVETAIVRGLSARIRVWRYLLRPSLGPSVGLLGFLTGQLLASAVLAGLVFDIPGIGRALVQAVLGRDYPVVQGIVFVFGFIVVVVSFFADLVSGWIDPRTGRA
jgi:peptide/nickel transport system permease protein